MSAGMRGRSTSAQKNLPTVPLSPNVIWERPEKCCRDFLGRRNLDEVYARNSTKDEDPQPCGLCTTQCARIPGFPPSCKVCISLKRGDTGRSLMSGAADVPRSVPFTDARNHRNGHAFWAAENFVPDRIFRAEERTWRESFRTNNR
jgi:hypothetical protein